MVVDKWRRSSSSRRDETHWVHWKAKLSPAKFHSAACCNSPRGWCSATVNQWKARKYLRSWQLHNLWTLARTFQNRLYADLELARKRHSLRRQDQSGHMWYDQALICSVESLRSEKGLIDLDTLGGATVRATGWLEEKNELPSRWHHLADGRKPWDQKNLFAESDKFTNTKWLANCQLATTAASHGGWCNQCPCHSRSSDRKA